MSSHEKRVEIEDYGDGFFRVILHYGFMEEIDVPDGARARSRAAARRSR